MRHLFSTLWKFGHENEADVWRCAASPAGYAWWYIDVSDGHYALSAILFAGAVFSPSYAERVRQGCADSGLDHPAVNLALYRLVPKSSGGRAARQLAWVMNEYPAPALVRGQRGLHLGSSRLDYAPDGAVHMEFSERQTRFFGRAGPLLHGRIHLAPGLPPLQPHLLHGHAAATHHWHVRAASARAQVDLRLGGTELSFTGQAYHDCNYGSGRLEQAFSSWGWAHGTHPDDPRDALILYRTRYAAGGGRSIAVHQRGDQATVDVEDHDGPEAPPALGGRGDEFRWMPVPPRFTAREVVCERLPDSRLLDTPFYARFGATLRKGEGAAFAGVGEYLDLQRFRSRGIQYLLRYKTRRIGP